MHPRMSGSSVLACSVPTLPIACLAISRLRQRNAEVQKVRAVTGGSVPEGTCPWYQCNASSNHSAPVSPGQPAEAGLLGFGLAPGSLSAAKSETLSHHISGGHTCKLG